MEVLGLLLGGIGSACVVLGAVGSWLPHITAWHRQLFALVGVGAGSWLSWHLGQQWAMPWGVIPVIQVVFGLWTALVIIDLRTMRLPNALVGWSVVLPLVTLPIAATDDLAQGARIVAAGAVSGLVYLALHLFAPHGLGLGDVKFSPSIGLLMGWHSWDAVFWAGALAFLMSTGAAFWMLIRRTPRRDRAFAFGPFMVAGAVTVCLAPSGIIDPCCVG